MAGLAGCARLADWARLGWPGWARLGWACSLAGCINLKINKNICILNKEKLFDLPKILVYKLFSNRETNVILWVNHLIQER